MPVGYKRTQIARICVVIAFVCGVIGLVAGWTNHLEKLLPIGWFSAGSLLTLIALFVLVDGAIAFQKPGT